MTPTDRPLSALVAADASLAQAWIDACNGDARLDEIVALEAASQFLQAMAVAIQEVEPTATTQYRFEMSCRTFAWASGSAERAVRALAALRIAVQHVLGNGVSASARDAVDRLLDQAIIAIVRDTTEELERDALVDPLTGLLNRRALVRNLEGELGRASRSESRFSLVFFDLDGLKAVNDINGHAAGDAVLVGMSEALATALRRGDSAYRLGGDEFVVVLPETEIGSADALVARLRSSGSPAFSWGAASYPNDGGSVEALLDRADHRLLDARRRHRLPR